MMCCAQDLATQLKDQDNRDHSKIKRILNLEIFAKKTLARGDFSGLTSRAIWRAKMPGVI